MRFRFFGFFLVILLDCAPGKVIEGVKGVAGLRRVSCCPVSDVLWCLRDRSHRIVGCSFARRTPQIWGRASEAKTEKPRAEVVTVWRAARNKKYGRQAGDPLTETMWELDVTTGGLRTRQVMEHLTSTCIQCIRAVHFLSRTCRLFFWHKTAGSVTVVPTLCQESRSKQGCGGPVGMFCTRGCPSRDR